MRKVGLPSFVQLIRHFVKILSDVGSIWDIAYSAYSVCLECLRYIFLVQHSSCHFSEDSILSFYNSFCCGVLGVEKLWLNPWASQNSLKVWFLNSPPWSVLIPKINNPFSFCTFLAKTTNWSNVSSFEDKKIVHENLEKSSTMTRVYKLPPKLFTHAGPTKSIWSSWRVD